MRMLSPLFHWGDNDGPMDQSCSVPSVRVISRLDQKKSTLRRPTAWGRGVTRKNAVDCLTSVRVMNPMSALAFGLIDRCAMLNPK